MITFKLLVGGEPTTGITFSVTETEVDTIYSIISAEDLNNQVVNMWFENADEKANTFDTTTADFSAALTISILVQASTATDVDKYLGIGVNLRDITVKLIS